MSLPVRVATLLVAFAAVAAGVIFVVIHYLLAGPPTVDYTLVAKAGQVNVTMQTDPQNTVTHTPDWVSYFIKNPQTGQWVHSTLLRVPADAQVNMTILGYDGCTPLRNQLWGKVTGTLGNVVHVDGKPVTLLNSWAHCSVQHTFSIPGLGLNVPIAAPLHPNLCGTSPARAALTR